MSLELTQEEISLITQKREEQKAIEDLKRQREEAYVKHEVQMVEDKCARLNKHQEDLKEKYTQAFNKLKAVSPNFELSILKEDITENAEIYELDNFGHPIRWDHSVEKSQKMIPRLIPVLRYVYNITLKYTGELPKDHEYRVVLLIKTNNKDQIIDYKMTIQGTNISPYGKLTRYSKPASVVKELQERANRAFITIKYIEANAEKQKAFDKAFTTSFASVLGTKKKTADSRYKIVLDNGIEVVVFASMTDDSVVVFEYAKIEDVSGKNSVALVEALSRI